MPYVLHPRSSSEGSYVASNSGITFSTERGPGAFAPLPALPRRPSARQRKSLFHIPDDDNTPGTPPQNSPPNTPPEPADDVEPEPARIPFPSSGPLSPPLSARSRDRVPSPPRITRSGSSSIILSNGKPLKSSLKSSSSPSIADDFAANRSLHTRAQSMPATPDYNPGPKNVHFNEGDKLATVRVFRSTGRPRSVSTQAEDTETETEPEHSAFPFPALGGRALSSSPLVPLMEIDPSPARTSTIPSQSPSPYANIHLESVSFLPSRPPVLRGAILVRNVAFEKRVGVRFTLDDWTTVSEVIATYQTTLSEHPPVLAQANLTVGDLAPAGPHNQWDRFSFSIRLEDYEARLADRTLVLAASYVATGAGEWWDNNGGANYRVAFRPRAPSPPPSRKPSAALFAGATTGAGALPPPPPPAASRAFPSPGVPTPPRPAPLLRSYSSPAPPTMRMLGRLALKHYAAPAPPTVTIPAPPASASPPTNVSPTLSPLKLVGGQFATQVDEQDVVPAAPSSNSNKPSDEQDERHVDEGFETGSSDGEDDKAVRTPSDDVPPAPARQHAAHGLKLRLAAPAPRRDPVTLASRGPFSPTRESPVPFASAIAAANGAAQHQNQAKPADATYAALIREWCFAQGDMGTGPNAGAGAGVGGTATAAGWGVPGKQNMLWVGMGG